MNRGFTLLKLLLVFAVVMILTTILFPQFCQSDRSAANLTASSRPSPQDNSYDAIPAGM